MKRLTDFVIEQEYQCADNCLVCNSPFYAKIKWIKPKQNYGLVLIYCKNCGNNINDLIGWEYSQFKTKFCGETFQPLVKCSNISICLRCEKIIATIPIIFWVNNMIWALYFCSNCVKELSILKKAGRSK